MIIVRVDFGADDRTRPESANRRMQIVGPFADIDDVQTWVSTVSRKLRSEGVTEAAMPRFSTTIVNPRRLALAEIRRAVIGSPQS